MSLTSGEALDEATSTLLRAGVESPRHDAQVLLAWVTGVARMDLGGSSTLRAEDQAAYVEVVARRAGREPLQHIVGSAAFRYLELIVGPGVFVPRPETELVAGAGVAELTRLAGKGRRPVAVDLCTGSGAVAIAMATEEPASRVVAVELSPEAYEYAVRNAAGLGIDVRCGDMSAVVQDLAGAVDVVTANPPYIPLHAFESVVPEVRDFDPPVALWSGDDGLDAIRAVEAVAGRLLVPGGLVVCEHADSQGESVTQLFSASGAWVEVRDHRDLAGRPRFVTARRSDAGVGAGAT